MEEYIERHIDSEPEHLKSLYRDANLSLLYTRMMSGHLQGRLLYMITRMINPRRVLELGTYAGYSTLCIAEGLKDDARIDTVEIDDELEKFLKDHFSSSIYGSKINLHIGDALTIVPRLAAQGVQWDMAYIDADKRAYPEYYEMLMSMMPAGSWIIADNTLWSGKVEGPDIKPHTGRKNAQLEKILEFNDMVAADSRVEKVILPVRDGLTLIRIK